MKRFCKPLALLLSLLLVFGLTACSKPAADSSAPESSSSQTEETDSTLDSTAPHDGEVVRPDTDRAGNPITLPENVQRVVSLAPSFTETLLDLDCADLIVGIDTQTQLYAYEELSADLPAFDMMAPDCEQIAALQPDLVIVSGMTDISGNDLYAPLTDLGICVVNIPSSTSIQGIRDDIAFLAACVGRSVEGAKLVKEMDDAIDEIAAIGATVTDKKTVYFEISAAPYCYSFGSDTFLNEMIELIGAQNIFADQSGWLSVEPESVVSANPDVILTSVNYIDDPVGELLARDGWQEVTAVKDGAVYAIDNQSSSLPNENIVAALREMAAAVYPELYTAVDAAA